MEIKKTVMVALAGRPNVGKSTLTNALVGEKVSIVTDKPQTTRHRICGIASKGDTQFVLLDTPGFHKAQNRLGDYMDGVVRTTVSDVDAVLLLIEPTEKITVAEKLLIEQVRQGNVPCILVINKIDLLQKKDALLGIIAAYSALYQFDAVIPVSARAGLGLDALMDELEKFAQESPALFPEGETSDQPERQMVAELLREAILKCLDKEIPHGVAVEIAKFSQRSATGLVDVEAVIYCEKASHKGIIIGKNGAMLKKISTMARLEMEKYMGDQVYLETWVRVKENWRDNQYQLRNFGYEQ